MAMEILEIVISDSSFLSDLNLVIPIGGSGITY